MELHTKLGAAIRMAWLAIAVLAFGTVGYVLIEHAPWMDALYMTVITVTTIGFREIFPLSSGGRIFTMVLALSGVGVMLYAVSVVASLMVETDIRRILGFRKEHRMIDKLTRHIVLCGAGRTGQTVIDILKARSEPFVVIERNAEQCRRLEQAGILVIQGDATERQVLEAAGLARAATMIASLADDAHNVYMVLLARRLNPGLKIIVRAVGDSSDEPLKLAGADTVINPYRTGAMRIAYTALKPAVIDFLDASLPGTNADLELAEIRIRPGSQLAGETLASANVRQRFGLIVVALRRGEKSLFNPPPDTAVEAGDVLVALGPTHSVEKLEQASV
ncbi:MAG: potassium channel protein [Acidobacteria bacterium]|nr:potassium channel protein [Acidobacteriota bacterium]